MTAQDDRDGHRPITADQVLEELACVAFSDLRNCSPRPATLKPLHDLTPAVLASIARIEVVMKPAAAGDGQVERVVTIHLRDKVAALTILAKHFGLVVDRVEASGEVRFTEKVQRARVRGAALKVARAEAEPIPAHVRTTKAGLAIG